MAIFDVIKTAAKVAQEAGKIELYGQILEVYEKLLEQQKRISDLEDENKKITEKFEIKEALVPEKNVYWLKKDNSRDGPFCTCCWDSERKLIRLHKSEVSDRLNCPKCNTTAKSGVVQVSRPIKYRNNLGV